MKISRPNTEAEVFEVMKKYCTKKEYFFSQAKLKYFAEQCFLTHESRGWAGCKYWPPLAMKWVQNAVTKFGDNVDRKPVIKEGKSIKEKIMEKEYGEES